MIACIGLLLGKWSVNGNHYEMQLLKDYGKYYNVTVAGNDDQKIISPITARHLWCLSTDSRRCLAMATR